MKKRSFLGFAGVVLSAVLALTACGSAQSGTKPASEPTAMKTPTATPPSNEPITLKVYTHVGLTDDEFATLVTDPVKAKFPNITIQRIKPGQGTQIQDLINSGQLPDMFMAWNGDIPSYLNMGIIQDIAPYVKKANIDLNRFDPKMIDALKSDKGELYGLPYKRNVEALYYNKDVFDKFGVSYPKDGMTWDDALALAKRLNRSDGGISYIGMDSEGTRRLMLPLSLTYVDAKTDQASVNTDQWARVFNLTKDIYSLQNPLPNGNKLGGAIVPFIKDGHTAMLPTANQIALIDSYVKQGAKLNWDLAQYPSYKELPNTTGYYDLHYMVLSKQSKYKDAVMQVMSLITSDDVQMKYVRSFANASPLKDPKFQQAFGADMPIMKGKNIAAIFKSHPAPVPKLSYYNSMAQPILESEFAKYVKTGTDVNTILHEANDMINQKIAGEKK